jgi:hypothetical protein
MTPYNSSMPLAEQVRRSLTVYLEGGPASVTGIAEVQAHLLPDRFVIERGGRRHHFERTATFHRVGDRDIAVFRWSYVTSVAE